jgi:hypothetical protein
MAGKLFIFTNKEVLPLATVTNNLNIPLIEGSFIVTKTNVNDALEAIDANALQKSHADSGVHWAGWKPGSSYSLIDVVRLTTMPSWGYLECTAAGTSGLKEPECPYSPGDTVIDGTVEWTMWRIGASKVYAKDVGVDDTKLKLQSANVQDTLEKIKDLADAPQSFNELEDVPQPLKDLLEIDGELAYKGSLVDKPIERAIVFVGSDVDIIFPWKGIVSQIQITLFSAHTEDLQFGIYYQTVADLEAGLTNWKFIGGSTYLITAGKVFLSENVNLTITDRVVFRSYVIGDDSDVTIHLSIK